MTVPVERTNAVNFTGDFLSDLIDPKKTPGIPKAVRQQAHSILRHYPSDWDLQQAAEASPHVFAERMEPVTRLFKQYEESKKSQ